MILVGSISGIGEICLAFFWCEAIEQGADTFPSRLESTLGRLAQEVFELGEDLFDRIEIWAIGRQKEEPRSGRADRCPNRLALVAAEIVEDHDITRLQRGDEHLFDIEAEQLAIDRAIDDPWRVDSIVAQSSKEGHRLPVAVGRLGLEPLATQTPPAQWRHVGLRPGLIDEDEPPWIDLFLTGFPARPLGCNARSVLLAWQNGFF